jgi:hypothetical protein
MEMEFVHVTYPTWFGLAVLGTLLFPFVAIPLSRRVRDPVALLMVLIAGNLTAAWADLARVAEIMSVYREDHRAAFAGGAEAQMPLFIGLFVASLTAAVCAYRLRSQQHRAFATLYLAAVVVAGVAVEVGFTWYMTRLGQPFSPRLEAIAQAGTIVSLALLVSLSILTFRPFRESTSARSTSAIFKVIGFSSGIMAIALWRFARGLTAVAMGQ